MESKKKFKCCCGLKFINHDGPISHAASIHRDLDLHVCKTGKCLAVVTVKVEGSKHRHDFGQSVAESHELSGAGDVDDGSSGDIGECSRSGEMAERSGDMAERSGDMAECSSSRSGDKTKSSNTVRVAECSRFGKRGKSGKKK